jgi:MGT family glycosyltransferase
MDYGVEALKRHVAFFGAPFWGHVNPTLAVLADLVSRGHRVTYVTTEEFSGAVTATGVEVARYESTWPAGRSAPSQVSADEMAGGPLKYLVENIAATGAEPAFDGDVPDVVVYDTLMHFAARALAHKWQRPAVQLIPLFASNEHFSVAQQLADEFPALDPQHPALIEFGTKLAEFRASYGMGEASPADFFGVVEDLNLVFLTKEYQPAAETFDERYAFVGAGLADPRTQEAWTPPEGDAPVLLIALGTLFNERPEFYRMCVEAFAEQPWHIVLATGRHVDPADLGPLPPNIEAHQHVPQLAVLEHAAAFVTHAGARSTMEALHFGVPMVAVPQSVELEMAARRTAELGLGVRIGRDEVTAERLREAVLKVTRDADIRRNVEEVRRSTREAGGAGRAADEIEAYLRRVLDA